MAHVHVLQIFIFDLAAVPKIDQLLSREMPQNVEDLSIQVHLIRNSILSIFPGQQHAWQ